MLRDGLRRLLHVSRLIRLACLALVLAACSAPPDGVSQYRTAFLSPAGNPADVRPIPLPDAWNKSGRYGAWDYRIDFSVDPRPDDRPWALYLPRAGNRFDVALNGTKVAQFGPFENLRVDFAQRPHLIFLPSRLLNDGANSLHIHIEGDKGRYGGLSTVYAGPAQSIQPIYLMRQALQTWGTFAVIIVSISLAIVSGALSVSMRDRAFALFTLACVFCAVRTSYAVFSQVPFDYRWWSLVTDGSLAGYAVCLCTFSAQALDMHGRQQRRLTAAMALLSLVLVPWAAFTGASLVRQLWLMSLVAYGATFAVWVCCRWWLVRTRSAAIIAGSGLLVVALALYDHVLVFYTLDGYGAFALSRYSLLIYLVAMGWLLMSRYTAMTQREAATKALAHAELTRQKREMALDLERQRDQARQRAQQDERRRILQDIHDGLGLQLNGLLGMAQSQGASASDLSREIRTAIEQMRMLVHNTESFDGDVPMLLGHIRYFVERRMSQAGIRLNWTTDSLCSGNQVKPEKALELQRLLFELVTNVIKHAGATTVRVVVGNTEAADPDALVICIDDDGVGFDAATAVRGRGLESVARRAEALSATCSVYSSPGGGTRCELRLSLAALAAPSAAFQPVLHSEDTLPVDPAAPSSR